MYIYSAFYIVLAREREDFIASEVVTL